MIKIGIYICPAGQELYRMKHRTENPKRIRYRNYEACKECEHKDKCTKSAKGREINRSQNQDFLDIVDARTKENMDKYLKRQMIVEHPFGTIKRTMNAGHFLTRGMESVKTESSLMMLSYNLKRVINILGISELISKIAQLRGYFLRQIENFMINWTFSYKIIYLRRFITQFDVPVSIKID